MNVQAVKEGQRADASIEELLRSAAVGDEVAWEMIVDSYSGLIWHVARAHRLSDSEAADVVQTTWLRLVQHLGRIRDPEAVGGWLVTTARRESLRALRLAGRERPTADLRDLEEADRYEQDPEVHTLAAEFHGMVWRCVDGLPERCRTLLRVLLADPPVSYQKVSAALSMPIGSIGPTRARCLQHLRHSVDRAGATP